MERNNGPGRFAHPSVKSGLQLDSAAKKAGVINTVFDFADLAKLVDGKPAMGGRLPVRAWA